MSISPATRVGCSSIWYAPLSGWRARRPAPLPCPTPAASGVGMGGGGFERLPGPGPAEQAEDGGVGRVEILRVLQDRQGALVVGAPHEHLAQHAEGRAVIAVALDHLQQLGLRLLPLMQRGEGARHHQAAVEIGGVLAQAARPDLDGIARPPERNHGVSEPDERTAGITAERFAQLVELFRRRR